MATCCTSAFLKTVGKRENGGETGVIQGSFREIPKRTLNELNHSPGEEDD
jgi:hypothetical protein